MAICPSCGEDNPDKARFCLECATPLGTKPSPPQEARKTVTVVFCDLVGSTTLGERLDTESFREVMDRYFTEMRAALEHHGGIVEKYIGDAVMAVFGLPRTHEDDALRAVRAAMEMGAALSSVNTELERYWGVALSNRTGVNTGEVVVGDPASGQRLVTGDAVNVAARLEQAAPVGQVLIGATTLGLVKDAVQAEAVEPLLLKGKSEPMPAFRVMEVSHHAHGVARHLDAPMVGRAEELSSLLGSFEQALNERTCHLVTVLGEAGVGKSRLVADIVARLRPRAQVLGGRCLSYGEGITFWPLIEVVKDAAGIGEKDSPGEARSKITTMLTGDEEAAAVSERLASVMGLATTPFPIEETFWASRRMLEALACHRPLVVVLEDIHWAEETFLDLVEHVLDLSKDASMLIVCPARRELLDKRPAWTQAKTNARTISLEPLSQDDSERLVGNLLGASELTPAARSRITEAAQGNPLFVEQIISMWMEDGTLSCEHGRWLFEADAKTTAIPPTISALLSARLDRLRREDRAVIAEASVVGQVFYRGAVQELSPPELAAQVPASLSTLTSKQFIRPEASSFAEEEGYAFRHVLIRDAAYEAMLKKTRAELHERFASWLEKVAGERIAEYGEILGYHLEQAFRYREALGPVGESEVQLAKLAAGRLSSAGRRAFARDDMSAAINLFERAQALVPPADTHSLSFSGELATALLETGDFVRADELLDETIKSASAVGDQRAAARAVIEQLLSSFQYRATVSGDETRQQAQQPMATLQAVGDELGLSRGWRLIAVTNLFSGRMGKAADAWEKVIAHARAAGNNREEMEALSYLALSHVVASTPVGDAVRFCDHVLVKAKDSRKVQGYMLEAGSILQAMLGCFAVAREMIRDARDIYQGLGFEVAVAILARSCGVVEMLAEDSIAAERELRWGYERLHEMREQGALSTVAGLLAQALYVQERYDEAEQFCEISSDAAAPSDVVSQALWRSCLAKVLAKRGNFAEAEDLAREAVGYTEETDFLNESAGALMDLAEILCSAKRQPEAIPSVQQALSLYDRKGNVVSAAKARKLLEKLTTETTTAPKTSGAG